MDFTTGTAPESVAIGDLDGDDKPDMTVVNNNSNTLSVFRNTSSPGRISSASFASKVDFTTGSSPYSVAIGDLDSDGKPDMTVVNYSSNTVSVFRNTSSPGSISPASFAAKVDFTTDNFPHSVAIGDLDGDGKPDLAVANSNSSKVSVFRNISSSGSISPASFAAKVDFTTGSVPVSVAIGDLDGDGKPDMAVANYGSNTVSVFHNDLNITAPAVPTGLTATPGSTQNVLAWTTNGETDLASYKVFGGTSAHPTTLLATVNAPDTSYTHASLTNGTMYYYRMLAVDNVGNESDTTADISAVPKETPVITFAASNTVIYGAADYAPGAVSTNSGATITYFSSNTSVATIVSGKIHVVSAGTTTITASQAGDATHFAAADVYQTLTVDKAVLSVTATDKSKTYGDANPAFTVTYSGFVNGDDETYLTTQATANTTATASSGVGTYSITASGATSPNYIFSYTDGTLTVNKAVLSITADDKSKTYGDANPALTVTYSGFVNGDDETDLTAQAMANTTAIASSGASTYPITVSGATSPNYTFGYTDGTLTVNTAALSITADDKSKTYGDANPAFTVTYSGFVNGDDKTDLTTQATANTTATASSGAGTYSITASGATSPNYTVSYTDGTLTVNKASLNITADDKSKTYGDANPALTVTYSGFVNSDDETDLTTGATASTAATASSDAGTYPITASGAASPNYTFSYSNGTLTVNKAALTITANDKSKAYGDANPALTVIYSGFVNGDDETSLTTQPAISTTATVSSPVGTYPVTVTGASSANYVISYVNGTLTVLSGSEITINLKINDQVSVPGKTVTLPLPIEYDDSQPSYIVITATSDNQGLVPDSGIHITGMGKSREISIMPIAGKVGRATIMITLKNGTFESSSSFTVVFNSSPLDITFSKDSFAESLPAETTVGTFFTDDPDGNVDSHTYTLVEGDGSSDNSSFSIAGDNLVTVSDFTFVGLKDLSIRVRSTDLVGDYVEQTFVLTLTADPEISLEIPTAFTPDGDGINDTWEIGNIQSYPGRIFNVFKELGAEIFSNTDYTSEWDGTWKGNKLPLGVYYFVIRLKNDQRTVYKGTLLLIR